MTNNLCAILTDRSEIVATGWFELIAIKVSLSHNVAIWLNIIYALVLFQANHIPNGQIYLELQSQ